MRTVKMADLQPSTPNKMPGPSLHVMTYNCLGLKYLVHYRKERLSEIGHQISVLDPAPHIVGLQECWVPEDFESIRRQTSSILPYSKFYWSGVFGAGLAILSKFPIEESSMTTYPINGRPTAFFRGDWFVGKGIAYARLRIPSSSLSPFTSSDRPAGPGTGFSSPKPQDQAVSVFTSHLHAPYSHFDNVPNAYLDHRTAQAWELRKHLRRAMATGDLVLALGDFNSLPETLPHRIITSKPSTALGDDASGDGLYDVWRILHPDSSLGPSDHPPQAARNLEVPSVKYNITLNGATSDNFTNTWRWSPAEQKRQYRTRSPRALRIISDKELDPNGKRLDYIFYGHRPLATYASNYDSKTENTAQQRWMIANAHVGMMQLHPTLNCSLSDHYSVHATFSLQMQPSEQSLPPPSTPLLTAELNTILNLFPLSFPQASPSSSAPYPLYRHEAVRKWFYSFPLFLIILPACLIGVWFTPNYGSFLLLLLSTLMGLVGIVFGGLIGWMWGRIEERSWRELTSEVLNEMMMAKQTEEKKFLESQSA